MRAVPWEERFWSRLQQCANGCIEWTGGKNRTGYGQLSVNGTTVQTHCLAWMLVHGPIPKGGHIRHFVCDNPPCCNPAHLKLGTRQDNMDDLVRKNQRRRECSHGPL